MKLINVRKGQFVYYDNKLHKVYSVKPFFKQSVHLIRLEDFEQQLTTAKKIVLYRPQHLDSFKINNKRYTLHKEVKAKVGDYILVINPRPDSLDRHHLHAIEMVSTIEDNGVISNNSNGIKHNEYWVLLPGLEEEATIIDLQKRDPQYEIKAQEKNCQKADSIEMHIPKIGDVFQKNDSHSMEQAMVINIKENVVCLGGNGEVSIEELNNPKKWSRIHHVLGQFEEG